MDTTGILLGLVCLFIGIVFTGIGVSLIWLRRERRKPKVVSRQAVVQPPLPPVETLPVDADNEEHTGTVVAKSLLSRAERAFYFTLRAAVGQDHVVFVQVPLRSLIKRKGMLPQGHYGMLENGIVDFVLAHPKYLGPVLAVELDDNSHWQTDSIQRDVRKTELLKWAGIPLLRVPIGSQWSVEQLRTQIFGLLRQTGKANHASDNGNDDE